MNDQEATWGYFDDDNGAYFGVNASGLFVATIRGGGAPAVIQQSSWNGDKLDGTGPSGLTLDIAEGNISEILYTWYGYGDILFQVVVNDSFNQQRIVTVHTFRPSDETSFADPNLPIRERVQNGAAGGNFQIFVSGRQYSILGAYNPNRRITCQFNLGVASVGTTVTPLISFRRKADFPVAGRTNSVSATVNGADLLSSASSLYQLIIGGTLSNTTFVTPTGIPANETGLEVNTTATTITGGIIVYEGLVESGSVPFGSNLTPSNELALDLPTGKTITLAMRTITGTATVSSVLRMAEDW